MTVESQLVNIGLDIGTAYIKLASMDAQSCMTLPVKTELDWDTLLVALAAFKENLKAPLESKLVLVLATQLTPHSSFIQEVVACLEKANITVEQLQSRSVCIAALYLYRHRQKKPNFKPFNLLVCRAGATSFDLSLCRIAQNSIEVLQQATALTDLNGVVYSRKVIEFITRSHVLKEDDQQKLLQAFEMATLNNSIKLNQLVDFCRSNPLLSDTCLYKLQGNYSLNLEEAEELFKPLHSALFDFLQTFQKQAGIQGQAIDQIAIAGGFSRFPLMRYSIKEILGELNLQGAVSNLIDEAEKPYAAALGAALIANKLVEPKAAYPHSLGIYTHRVSGGFLQPDFITLIEAGRVIPGCSPIQFYPKSVRITSSAQASLKIGIRHYNQSNLLTLELSEVVPDLPPNLYRIAIDLDCNNRAQLIFEAVQDKSRYTVALGQV